MNYDSKKNNPTVPQADLGSVSEAEWAEALHHLEKHLRRRLRHKTQSGAFCEAELGMSAVDYFRSEASFKLLTGAWRWDTCRTLADQLIIIADNLMSKHAQQYVKKPEVLDLASIRDLVDSDDEQAMVDAAYHIAAKRVCGDRELEEYLQAVRQYNDYREISQHLHITINRTYKLQTRLLKKLKKKT